MADRIEIKGIPLRIRNIGYIMEHEIIIRLIAYCQRQGILSSNDDVLDELADILDLDKETIEELYF